MSKQASNRATNGHAARAVPPPIEAPQAAAPHVIHPNAVYSVAEAQTALRLRESTIRRELRLGHLRVSRRAGRHYLLGVWLLEWLQAGEIRRRQSPAEDPNQA